MALLLGMPGYGLSSEPVHTYAEDGTAIITVEQEERLVQVGETVSLQEGVFIEGNSENGESFRAVVKDVQDTDSGISVYEEGMDSLYIPTEAAGKTYVVVYQGQVSLDGETWNDVEGVSKEARIVVEGESLPETSEETETGEETEIEPEETETPQESEETVHLVSDESAGASVGVAYTFGQDDHVTVSGPQENGEQYRAVVVSVTTPEGGSYTYTEGDSSFTPSEADRGLVYAIQYGAQVSLDGGATWQMVPNVSSVTYLTVEFAQIGLRSPVYPGLFADLTVAFDEETYTGSLVSTTINIAINGTATADDPFYMDVIIPKEGIYSKDDADPRYRFQISDLPQALDSSFTEDANNYIKTYKLKPGTDALVYSIPMKLKMLRTGLITDGTPYTVKLRIRTLDGTVITETDNTTKMKIGKPTRIIRVISNSFQGFYLRTDSPYLDAAGTALKTDVDSVPNVIFDTKMERNIPTDFNGDEIGIRKISQIVDTYTLPDITYVDTAALPSGCVWNPATHTMTCTMDDSLSWKSSIPFTIKLPGAVINQDYPVEVKREYRFSDPSEDFSFTFHQNIRYYISNYYYSYSLSGYRSQSGYVNLDYPDRRVDNLIDWNSNPYVETGFYRILSTSDPNPVSYLTQLSLSGMQFEDTRDENLLYDKIVLNSAGDSKPTGFNGTFSVIGTKADGTLVTIAQNIAYPSGSSTEISIADDFRSVAVVPSDDAYLDTILSSQYANYSRCTIRYVYKFKSGLDPAEPYVFKGNLTERMPSSFPSGEGKGFYDYGRSYFRYYSQNYDNPTTEKLDYPYAFHYHNQPKKTSFYGYGSYNPYENASITGNPSAAVVGDTFIFTTPFNLRSVEASKTVKNGVLKVRLPIGIDLVPGSEVLTLNSNCHFTKSMAEILASKSGPLTDSDGAPYYLYTIGDVDHLVDEGLLLKFQGTAKVNTIDPSLFEYSGSSIYAHLTFNDGKVFDCKEKTTERTYPSTTPPNPLFGIHHFHSYITNQYVIEATKEEKQYRIEMSSSFPIKAVSNQIFTWTRRVTNSGFDYYNDVIDVEATITTDKGTPESFSTGKITLTIPSGFEIIPGSEVLVDNNGNFISDKSLTDIINSRTGMTYDFGHSSVASGKNWNLTLKLKLKVTENALPGSRYFNLRAAFVNSFGGAAYHKEQWGSEYRRLNYVPTNGFYSMLTGYDVTDKSYAAYGEGKIKYEYTIGNFTGSEAQNVSIIDYLPGVGDFNGNGSDRNSQLRPVLNYVSCNSGYTVYYSYDAPSPGMTVAGYDAVARWITWLPNERKKDVKAIKIMSSTPTSKVPVNFMGTIATMSMSLPGTLQKSIENDNGKQFHNSFSVKYQTGSLSTNYVDSNIKTYEVSTMRITGRIFVDVNRNGIYDAGDTSAQEYVYGKIYKDGVEVTSTISDRPYDSLTGVYTTIFHDYTTGEDGNYDLKLESVPSGYSLCPYGTGDNQSNIHPGTLRSDMFNLSRNGTKEAVVNIGLQYNGYLIKYDLNGGHFRGSTDTSFTQLAMPGQSVTLAQANTSSYLNPYHFSKSVWNTMPDGSGTSYTSGQTVPGGLSSVGDTTVTLYLQWQKIDSYTVRYDRSGPNTIITGTMPDDTVTVGDSYTVKHNAFVNPSGTFDGWNGSQNGNGESFYEGQQVPAMWDGDPWYDNGYGGYNLRPQPVVITLYAQWSQTLYTFKSADTLPPGEWDYAKENPEHPIDPDYSDPTKHHPWNYVAKVPVAGVHFAIYKYEADGSKGALVSSANSRTNGELYFPNMKPGKYYLSESNVPSTYLAPNTDSIITVTVDQFTGDLKLETVDPADTNASRPMQTGEYDFYMKSLTKFLMNKQARYRNYTLTTRVADENVEYASINQNFRYRLTFLDDTFAPLANTTINYTGGQISGVVGALPAPANGSITTDEHGAAYITLKHGQSATFLNIPGDSKISAFLATEGGDVHTQVDNGGFAYTPSRSVTINLEGTGNDKTVDFKILNFVPVPMGVKEQNTRAYMLLGAVTIAMLYMLSMFMRQRRHRHGRG